MAIKVGQQRKDPSPPPPQQQQDVGFTDRQRLQVVVLTVLLLSAVLFVWIGNVAEEVHPEDIVIREKVVERTNEAADTICFEFCKARRERRHKHFGGDLLNRNELVTMVETAKSEWITKLQNDYGTDNFEKIFVDETKPSGYKGFIPVSKDPNDSESVKRLRRKIQIKVLSMQTALKKQDSNANDCDCVNGDKALTGNVGNITKEALHIDPTYERYVWATGGHSASAGHGNLYNESYTAFLERDMKGILGAIGIDFEGRNYAMGGTSSASEISFCSEQIFGSDVDFLSWDYGMTDGNYPERLLHYGYRGGISPGRPALLGVKINGRSYNARRQRLETLEELGMAVFYGYEESLAAMRAAIPDTLGMNDEAIKNMPEYVRNMKCNDKIEDGEPYCKTEKFTKGICSPRNKQTSWHPGMKVHAMDGHSLALFLVQAVVDALKDLAEKSTDVESEVLLRELQKEEDEQFQRFLDADLPSFADNLYDPGKDNQKDPDLDMNVIYKGPSICHTGRLPSQTRYLGYLMNNGKVGGPMPLGEETFETGIEENQALKEDAKGVVRLTYKNDKDHEKCPVLLKPDYKDYFFTHAKDGWSKLTFPNEAEKKAYRYNQAEFKGMIAIILSGCDWGKCAVGDLKGGKFAEGMFEMTVNGKAVTSLSTFGFGAQFLKGDQGLFWEPSSNGDYEIGINVKQPGGFVKISSLILY